MIRDSAYNRLPKRDALGAARRASPTGPSGSNRERDRELEFQEIVGYHLEQARRYLAELAPLDEEGRELGRRAAAPARAGRPARLRARRHVGGRQPAAPRGRPAAPRALASGSSSCPTSARR